MNFTKKLIRYFKFIKHWNLIFNRTHTYSQYGEDNIILLMLGLYNIKNATYIDIGAHHPYKFSNTALLYEKGIHGINIEPDPFLYNILKKKRKRDTNLNIGLHEVEGESILFQFTRPEFNTISIEAAQNIIAKGIKKIGEYKIKISTYNCIVRDYLNGQAPDLLLIDAEGLDELILKSIDFRVYSPKIICIETFAYGIEKKNNEVAKYLLEEGYSIHADTFVNTLFVKSNLASNVLS